MNIKQRITHALMWRVRQICRQYDISLLYQSKAGIKYTNQFVSSDMFDYFISSDTMLLSTEDLHFGVDFLKDPYTLLACPVRNTPYFELMRMFQSGCDITHSDYMVRAAKGTLDTRSALTVSSDWLKKKYNKKIKTIQAGVYEPIKVYKVRDKYFIADGRHTASVCALIGVNPKCVEVSKLVYDSYFWWIYRKMLKHKNNYGKHIKFFESLLSTKKNINNLNEEAHAL
ncbi:MAG: hypothetical protein HON76_04190 [Candidatus Scalindua sp.]|jgi:hypothetical protein|nr:hypothetical protein [Candidatus Scalindua sp.]MBT6227974.1 hypothetical protein [Candidatus Scalindua sp.]MBT6561710.1 hypothetical protein [Candidatus Scalindua sp.]MBT7211112.1 hypothetical protein [Candidatus Scalindua sp.]